MSTVEPLLSGPRTYGHLCLPDSLQEIMMYNLIFIFLFFYECVHAKLKCVKYKMLSKLKPGVGKKKHKTSVLYLKVTINCGY